jgi:hypothetical protein
MKTLHANFICPAVNKTHLHHAFTACMLQLCAALAPRAALADEPLTPSAAAQVPGAYLCPISKEIMVEPLLLVETGQTYEGANIRHWLETHSTCPLTSNQLSCKQLAPNHVLRGIIQQWAAEHGVQLPAVPKHVPLMPRTAAVPAASSSAAAAASAATGAASATGDAAAAAQDEVIKIASISRSRVQGGPDCFNDSSLQDASHAASSISADVPSVRKEGLRAAQQPSDAKPSVPIVAAPKHTRDQAAVKQPQQLLPKQQQEQQHVAISVPGPSCSVVEMQCSGVKRRGRCTRTLWAVAFILSVVVVAVSVGVAVGVTRGSPGKSAGVAVGATSGPPRKSAAVAADRASNSTGVAVGVTSESPSKSAAATPSESIKHF